MDRERVVPSCFDKAVELLGRRSHFEAELRRKLKARRYPVDEVERTLKRLRELGHVDDVQTAHQWVEAERARRPQGRARLRHGLEQRGADAAAVERALEPIDDEAELADARRAAARWGARRPQDRDRLARHLNGRGFGKRVILTVLEDLFEGSSCAGEESGEPF